MQPEYIIYKCLAYHFGDITALELKAVINKAAKVYHVQLRPVKNDKTALELIERIKSDGLQTILPKFYMIVK